MENKIRCQSCGMPLGVGFYGTNSDETANDEYCKLCYEKGNFCEPNLTLEEMMGRATAHMIDELHMSRERSEQQATEIIPKLKRWNNTITFGK